MLSRKGLIGSLCAHARALKAQEAAKKASRLSERQQGGGDLQSRAPTTTQTKEDSPKVHVRACFRNLIARVHPLPLQEIYSKRLYTVLL